MMFTLFYFIIALLMLVLVHEYGHFIVARYCGVKVLRFSFGFGKVLASWRDKRGTEYAFSLVPLGGYIQMLDESEGEVPESERHLAFNNQSIAKRCAIALAGPLFNFLFAFFALWLVLIIGIKSLAPIVSEIKIPSLAAQAGLLPEDEILSFGGKKISSWHDFQYALMPLVGTNAPVAMKVKSIKNGQERSLFFPLEQWHLDGKNPNLLNSLGMVPFLPKIPPLISEIVIDSPADSAGLLKGDRISRLNGQPIFDWLDVVDIIKKHPNTKMTLTVFRKGQSKALSLHTGSVIKDGVVEGFMGARANAVNWPANWLRMQREAPLPAVATALKQTFDLIGATFSSIGHLIIGKIPIESLSGPIGIAQGAGESAKGGLAHYLSFLALLSISLGVLNLLPIPLLDGGHLLYYLIELIWRRPLSEQLKSAGIYLGVVFLVSLMIIAFSNDLTR